MIITLRSMSDQRRRISLPLERRVAEADPFAIAKECTIASRRSCRAHFRSRATWNFSREFVSSFEPAYVTTAFKGTIGLTARSFLPGVASEMPPDIRLGISDSRCTGHKTRCTPRKNIRPVR